MPGRLLNVVSARMLFTPEEKFSEAQLSIANSVLPLSDEAIQNLI